jgi:hypothetical protein
MTVRHDQRVERRHPSFGGTLARTMGVFWIYAFGAATVAVYGGELIATSLQRVLPREPTALTSTAMVGIVAAFAYDHVASIIRTRIH